MYALFGRVMIDGLMVQLGVGRVAPLNSLVAGWPPTSDPVTNAELMRADEAQLS